MPIALLLALAPAGPAQAAVPTAAGAAAEENVLVFPAAFFAGAQPATALDMIARVPGFTFAGGDTDVRGLAGAAGNVLIDGRRQATKEDLATVLGRISAGAVLRIELIRGGARGIDMQGQPVLANVVRRPEAAVRGQAEASIGRYGDGRVTPALRANVSRRSPDTLSEAAVYLYRTVDDEKGFGPRVRTNADGTLRQSVRYDEHDGFRGGEASLAHERPLAGGRLRLTASAKRARERADTVLDTSFPAAGRTRVLELETNDEAEVGANWDGKLGSDLALTLIALQRLTRDDASEASDDGTDAEGVGERARGGESIVRGLLRWQATSRLAIEGGSEAAYNFLDSHAALSLNGQPVALPAANVRVAEKRAEPFVTATWQVSAPLSIEAGLRVETSRLVQSGDSSLTRGFVFPKPRLRVTWSAGPHTQFRLRLEREVGQLDFGDFVSSASLTSNTVTAGNADLEPQRQWTAEVAWERRFLGAGALVLTARHDWISHVVDRVGVIGPGYAFDAPGNIGAGSTDRIAAELSLPLDRLGLRGGLIKADGGYRRTRVVDPTTGRARPISGEAPIDGEVHFTYDRPSLAARLGADVILAGDEPQYRFDEVRRQHLGARVSLFAEWRPSARWTLRAFAENVTGRSVVRERDIYAGPRNSAALRYVEVRDLATRPLIGLRARRSFGK